MKKNNFIFPAIFFLLLFSFSQARAYEVEIDASKKIFHIGELGLPGEMSLLTFLATIPELADRSSDTFLSRYDVKLDGKQVSESKDAFLSNTFLREIECVEIETSPSESQIKNGISGSINVVPIPIAKGFSGDANVSATLMSGVMPTLNLRYSDGAKFEARADFDFDVYYPSKLSYKEIFDAKTIMSGADTTRERYFGQLARFYAKWKISDKDALRVWLWQDYSFDRMSVFAGRTTIEDMSSLFGPGMQRSTTENSHSESLSKKLAFACFVDYKRQLKTGEFSAKADYHFKTAFPGKSDELNAELKSVTKFNLRERKLNMDVALNSSVNSNREINDRLYYISPNIRFYYSDDHIQAILRGRYKGYSRAFAVEGGREFSGWSQDWTAEANLFWQIVNHHALRLKLLRSAGIAANNLVYPEMTYDKGAGVWKKGNPNLKGPVTNSATLEYIHDWSSGPHRIVFNIGTELNFVDRMIKNQILFNSDSHKTYLYPTNSARSRVADLCAMLRYSYGIFSITAGGNLFYNMEYALLDKLNASYFNFQLNPSVQLKNNWLLNANFIYNSRVYNQDFTMGDCTLLNLRVSKSLNNWTFYLVVEDVFDDISTDVEKSGAVTTFSTYDPHMRQLTLGVSFHF